MEHYPDTISAALDVARKARSNAFAPYSRFRVGAAVKPVGSHTIYAGCNVENSSYGATICAERGAILSMVASGGAAEIEYVLVVTDADPLAVPCALCLQVIAQFAGSETRVFLSDTQTVRAEYRFSELLPRPFVFDPPT